MEAPEDNEARAVANGAGAASLPFWLSNTAVPGPQIDSMARSSMPAPRLGQVAQGLGWLATL